MTQLSPNFTLEEMTATSHREFDNAPSNDALAHLTATAQQMERVRSALGGHPIHVNSGYRSPEVNAAVGGASNSAHLLGYACDFICPAVGTPLTICGILARAAGKEGGVPFDQLIEEGTWVHISFDPRMRGEVLTKAAGGGYAQGLPK